ncbi:MAG: serine hydrolase [Longimicrobiales bacterium]
MTRRTGWVFGALTSLLLASACQGPDADPEPARVGPDDEWAEVAARLTDFIEREMDQKGLPALSVALVDGDRVVWADGFGWEDPVDSIPADAATVYRVGSVSKLLTDLAVMQQVEAGVMDLDAPVARYVPDFAPENPFGGEITLRHLMAHRSGLVREPPVGNYFDDTEPTLAATVESLNGTALVYAPGTRTKYSNAAIATVGRALEATSGEPFSEALERSVLEPLGMDDSSFEPAPDVVDRLAAATMWTWDGRAFDAPTFQLGMAPAGSMYTTVLDLGRFMSMLFAGGQGPSGAVVGSATLEEMWSPQFAAEGGSGFGLGFALGDLEGERVIRHGGAIYGFATELAALPDQGLGVVAVTTLDGANVVTSRVATAALEWMMDVRSGRPLRRAPRPTVALEPVRADALEGRYGSGASAVDLREFDGRLYYEPVRGGGRYELRAWAGDTLMVDGRLSHGRRMVARADGGVEIDGEVLPRLRTGLPDPAPERFRDLLGEYGWDHNVLYVLEKDGLLHALVEWFYLYPLEERGPDHFAFPDWGLYDGEELFFRRGPDGAVTSVEAASVEFVRRDLGTVDGQTFRIDPVRPVDQLLADALAASPPAESGTFREPDLVELTTLDDGIRRDIRYAGTNNFMGAAFYQLPLAFMQRPAAAAVAAAQRALGEQGYGLLIYDAYRPWYVTKMFWDATPEDQKLFVADPSAGSRHNRGAAVDLTMYDLATGAPVETVSGYDEFSPRAFPEYPGGTSRQRWFRELLRETMEEQGFSVYEWEWWHFDYDEWREYPILNLRFEELGATAPGGL